MKFARRVSLGWGIATIAPFCTYVGQESLLAWSPDGQRIAFDAYQLDWNDEIYVMNTDGTRVTRLTNHPASDYYPAWSPDGRRIAFVSGRDGNDEIYVMNADGTRVTRLTNHPGWDVNPAWCPK